MKNFEAKLLQRLIQIKSISGREGKLAGFILEYCQKKGIAGKKQNGNVVVHIKGEDRSRALIFNAHMDTVVPGKVDKWEYPPFGNGSGKIADGKLYGLGASDDKAAVAAILILAGYYSKRVLPPIDLWFTFVTSEETDGSGTAAFLKWFIRSKYFKTYKYISAIIGEPTDLAKVEIGHRGNTFIELTTHGISTHSAHVFDERKLAVPQMLAAISKLKEAFQTWKKTYKDDVLGEASMNITDIRTVSSAVKKIPGICQATLDIRTTPKLHFHFMKLLKDLLGENIVIKELYQSQPPGLTSPESKIVRIFENLLPEVGQTISVGSTDLFQFNLRGIDTAVFGPGNMKSIHKENEYVELSKVAECVKLYKKIIDNF